MLQPHLHQSVGAQRASSTDICMQRGLRGAVLQPRMSGSGLEGRAQAELRAAEGQERGGACHA